MKKKLIFVLLLSLSFCFLSPSFVKAGFGISPARLWNDRLVPGSHFEQTITLTRSNPQEAITIETSVDSADIKGWIKIKEGGKFIYPAGPMQFPITVIIDVPQDAGYGTYYGKLSITTSPGGEGEGQVTVALGATVDIKLRVSGDQFSDFKIRSIAIPDLEEGWPIKFMATIENLGNVKVRPSLVNIKVFDDFHQREIVSGAINNMTWVDSFKVGLSEGELRVNLEPGQYWADYEIYKEDGVVLKNKIRFYVYEKGTLIPPPLLERLKNYILASPLRLVLFTFLGTVILIALILVIIKIIKRRKRKK